MFGTEGQIPFVVRSRFWDTVCADLGIEIRAPGLSKPGFRVEGIAKNTQKSFLKDSGNIFLIFKSFGNYFPDLLLLWD